MKSKGVVIFVGIFLVFSLSHDLFRAVGLSQSGGWFNIDIPDGWAKYIIVFCVPVGMIATIKCLYIALHWCIRMGKSAGKGK
ncbi:hypothetical protein JEQ04_02595 [Serratia plymuthica]|uniref:hypothetical protein n=1 Tax=Serratia plymuthica TaxID=82996 RepID=UPI0018E4692F|nr:hypothetical protein [Serratia plymuthica]MBI6136750.1 hypothetical protein [Serratia plymuthica]